MNIERGFRGKLDDYLSTASAIQIRIITNGSSVYDSCCFGVDNNNKLSDERYMIFYNQPDSPAHEISLKSQGNTAEYSLDLSKLPQAIEKLVFTVSIDGDGTMEQIQSQTIQIIQNGQTLLETTLKGSDFNSEKSIIGIEIYRKSVWRLSVVARGYNNGGLAELIQEYGGVLAGENTTSIPQEYQNEVIISTPQTNLVQTSETRLESKQETESTSSPHDEQIPIITNTENTNIHTTNNTRRKSSWKTGGLIGLASVLFIALFIKASSYLDVSISIKSAANNSDVRSNTTYTTEVPTSTNITSSPETTVGEVFTTDITTESSTLPATTSSLSTTPETLITSVSFSETYTEALTETALSTSIVQTSETEETTTEESTSPLQTQTEATEATTLTTTEATTITTTPVSTTKAETKPIITVPPVSNDAALGIAYPRPSGNTVIKLGSNGNDVKWLQAALNKALGTSITVDGDFGYGTKSKLTEFQERCSLTADGEAGKATINGLVDVISGKKKLSAPIIKVQPYVEPSSTYEEKNANRTTQDQKSSVMVWVPKSGKKYHSNKSCSNMKNPKQMDINDAIAAGYGACSKCY